MKSKNNVTGEEGKVGSLDELRKVAEAQLAQQTEEAEDLSKIEANDLIYELRTQQIELELQNEELRRTHLDLIDSQRRYSDLYDFAPVGYVTLSVKGVIVEANLTLARMLAVERRNMVTEPLSAYIHEEDQDIYYHHRRILLDTKMRQSCKVRVIRKDSEPLWVEMETLFLGADEENDDRLQMVIIDITERRALEIERESLIDKLEIKNTALDAFTYTVSHDLKSPLITINWFVGMLKNAIERNDTERIKRNLDRINEASSEMHSMLQDILKLSRVGSKREDMSLFNAKDALLDVMELLYGQITARGAVIQITSGLGEIYGERGRIMVVFQNLIDNAIKFCPEGTTPHVEIGWERQEDHLKFHVKDNGQGVDKEYQSKVFQIFEKLEARSEGSGVGLALVKSVVELHGGRIWLESEGEGKGSTFCFTLPRGAPV